MSEWRPVETGAERDYSDTPDELAVYAFHSGVSHVWCGGVRVPGDQSPTDLEGAKAAGEAELVAYVLIALAKRAAAWVESIDAQLAREYRAARKDVEQHLSNAMLPREAQARLDAAEQALLRGWP